MFPPENFSWLRPWHLRLACVQVGTKTKRQKFCRKQ